MSRLGGKRLVNKNVQVGLTGSFIAISVACAMFQVVLLNRSLGQLARQMGEPEALLDALPSLLMNNLLITVGTLLPAMWIFGVFITHRLAGPINHFERYLERVAQVGYEGPCKIRDGDELQDLCAHINAAVDRLRAEGRVGVGRGKNLEQAA